MRTTSLDRLIVMTGALVMSVPAIAALDIDDPGVDSRKRILQGRIFQHFALGTTASIDWFKETRDQNGCRWDFRQAYFSGGAQKGWDMVFYEPWNKWVNPKKVKGVFGERFIKASVEAGFIPWVTMYNLAQSKPAEYKPGPAKATPVNARNTSTMRAYWEQVIVVMKIAAKYAPHPVVIHVEPDEWGHMLLGAPGRNGKRLEPLAVDVKVGSTGVAGLEGLEDNMRGYSHAWLKLRALHAPHNVILVTNPSAWDQRGSMSASNWIRIFKEADVTLWDAAVLETGDRDIGCIPGKGAAPPYEDVTTTGSHFSNLNEQLSWIGDFYKGTGLPVYFWQVGVGIFYFRSCNQTKGHFCDMIAQALLEGYPNNPMIAKYVSVGCYGFVFSPGQGHQTHVDDAMKDGITNPDPIPGNLGHVSQYADDDGGYMRLRAGEYYKQPYPILAKRTPVAKKKEKREPIRIPAPQVKKAKPDAIEMWDHRLIERVHAAVTGGARYSFFMTSLRQKVQLLSFEADGSMKVRGGPVTMDMSWERLTLNEKKSLAAAVVRPGNPEDHCMAAFYFLAANDKTGAQQYISGCGEMFPFVEECFE